MLTASIVLSLYAAISGLVMAVRIFSGAKPWRPVALGHGILAVSALALALWAATATGAAVIKWGVAILVLAALGGLFLLGSRLRSKSHPWAAVVLHGLLALAGVGCLLYGLLH